MSGLRKIADEWEARACLSGVASSGETVGAWARRHGVDGRSLHAWHNNLARRSGLAPRGPRVSTLVELVPAPPRRDGSCRYIVRVGDATVEVGDDFEPETLRRILGVLAAC
jgi:transposase-like protein